MNTVGNVYDEGCQDAPWMEGPDLLECMWKRNGISEVARRRLVQVSLKDRHKSQKSFGLVKVLIKSTASSFVG
jgi:hypothetical protein